MLDEKITVFEVDFYWLLYYSHFILLIIDCFIRINEEYDE